MNTDVEDLLREGMERFTADLRAPAGMTHWVARWRRRRLALRSAAAVTAVLAAGALALVAAWVPGARHNGTEGSVVYAAYVVKRVDSALSAATPAAIAQMTVTTTRSAGGKAVTTTGEEWSYGDRWRSVTYSSAGHPVYDEGFSNASVYTLVNYQARTYVHQPGLGRPATPALGPKGCAPLAAAVPLLFQPGLPAFQPALSGLGFAITSPPATVAKALRTAISCGTLVVAGRQRVDGIEAIELTSRRNSLISETIWVSPGTYLPVRVVVRSGPCTPFPQQTADITWLPPTAQNLAKLTVPIPAGFRRVSLFQALRLNLPQMSGGPLPKSIANCLPTPPGLKSGPALPAPTQGLGAG
jgi:hypothetical protein